MDNKEILDRFGRLTIKYVYDEMLSHFRELRTGTTRWNTGKEYTEILNKLSDKDKDVLSNYVKETASTVIFSFLKIFEENPEFKIIFEGENIQIDLNTISEMLAAEHHGDTGWIKSFSRHI